ncbi:trypsin-like peptidase domain-containing protein [Actinospica sp. MGRD01-02]|uniref:Trypsin-like peptidase domain-containing protein n=1 Tax=Actinospica acidithermotolerans TaxID=2828514 RepID=A0A941EF23_9ACTN|nr:trypsin-like peptidase domain-containing protein [Actinospica acidithermotolerans]MBR7829312.1 trypsin-like peptidase domain-containing protein [Actinospica acidithermotolerans]
MSQYSATSPQQDSAHRGVVLVSTRSEEALSGGGTMNSGGDATGIVLSTDGEILTNNHAISGATSVTVTDPATGKRYRGTVAGYSVADDLAVIQLADASGLSPAPLGDSQSVRPGQRVTAVGNANGNGRLIDTAGSVLATGQTATLDGGLQSESLKGLIIHGADVVDGDSGGPLLDANGRVVGITVGSNSEWRSSGEPITGLAIPIDGARAIAAQIRAGIPTDTVHIGPTAFLGDQADQLYLDPDARPSCTNLATAAPDGSLAPSRAGLAIPGVCVDDVAPGSPADSLGVGVDDVIVALDGRKITSYSGEIAAMTEFSPGQSIRVDWISSADGRPHHGTVTLAYGPPL